MGINISEENVLFTFRIEVFYLKFIIECTVVGRVPTIFDKCPVSISYSQFSKT
jgi:hypothetical protein